VGSARAVKFLEALQRQVRNGVPRDFVPDPLVEQFADVVAAEDTDPAGSRASWLSRMRERHNDGVASAPTPLQDPDSYRMLITLVDAIEATLFVEKPTSDWPTPTFGTLETGQVNAMTIAVPGAGDHVIVFEEQLFIFALLMSKAVAQAVPYREEDGQYRFAVGDDDIIAEMTRNSAAQHRFNQALLAYAVSGRTTDAPQYVLEDVVQMRLTAWLLDAMELFVVGHEYGHVLLGHLTETNAQRRMLPADVPVDEIEYSWLQEHAADRIGMMLSIKAMGEKHGVDLSIGACGAALFLGSMDVMDRAVSLLRHGDHTLQRLSSHPPSCDRLAVLRAVLTDELGAEAAAGPIMFGERIGFVMERFWAAARPLLEELRSRGQGPAAIWMTR
jgi:hypothetical protein